MGASKLLRFLLEYVCLYACHYAYEISILLSCLYPNNNVSNSVVFNKILAQGVKKCVHCPGSRQGNLKW